MKITHIYSVLILSILLTSFKVLSQQNVQNELSGTRSPLSEMNNTGDNTEYAIEKFDRNVSLEREIVSKGFMPADDYNNERSEGNTLISFTLLNPGFVSIKIYDHTGKSVDEISKSIFGRGNHLVKWNRSKFANKSLFYSIVTSEFSRTEKIK